MKQVCNGDSYVKIPAEDMRVLWQRKMELMSQSPMNRLLNVLSPSPSDSEADRTTHDSSNKMVHRIYLDDSMVKYFMTNYGINPQTVVMERTKAPIQIDTVPEGVLNQVARFYCCVNCGKVFLGRQPF